ncbi:reverse transcriptase domain-containing protein [Tanacetum coccineum]
MRELEKNVVALLKRIQKFSLAQNIKMRIVVHIFSIISFAISKGVRPDSGDIRPIAVRTIWRRLVSKVCAVMVGHSLDGYLDGLQFGVGVSGGGEAILHVVNRLIKGRGDDVGLSMLLVDFKNAFNLVDRGVMLQEVRLRCPSISRWVEFCYSNPARLYYGEHTLLSCQGVQQGDPLGPLLFSSVLHPLICKIRDSFSLCLHAWYLDDGTIVGDTLVVGKVLELIMEDGPRCGLHLNVDKTEVFWPKEDPKSRLEGIFPPNISWPVHGVKLLGGPASVDFDFGCELVKKRVSKTIELMDKVAKINDPQCELLLLRACTGISKLYFAMRTCPPRFFESAQCSFDVALHSALERIVTASGPGFGDWQWRLATLPFAFGGLGTKLLRHAGIFDSGPSFDDALCVFNTSIENDIMSNSSEIAAPKLMKKLADIYFTRVTNTAESTFSLSPRQMALWKSQIEDHTSYWLRVVLISGLGQTMNGKTYSCVLCYRLGVPLFFVSKPCSACSRVFTGDIYEDHAVSCAGVIGIKRRHNVVRDTLVDIGYWSRILAGKEVDIGLDGGRDKPLRPADMLLYSWDRGLDVCVDLTGFSPLTQTGMADFVPGRAVIDAAQRKRVKYEAKCAAIGYGFLPFSFSSLGELEGDAVTLLKWIRKFSMTQDVGARAAIHIFNRIGFVIAKGVGAQLVSRLPTNFLVNSWASKVALHNAVEKKKRKYATKCADNGYNFIPFSFSTFGEFDKDALDTLSCISQAILGRKTPTSVLLGSYFGEKTSALSTLRRNNLPFRSESLMSAFKTKCLNSLSDGRELASVLNRSAHLLRPFKTLSSVRFSFRMTIQCHYKPFSFLYRTAQVSVRLRMRTSQSKGGRMAHVIIHGLIR